MPRDNVAATAAADDDDDANDNNADGDDDDSFVVEVHQFHPSLSIWALDKLLPDVIWVYDR